MAKVLLVGDDLELARHIKNWLSFNRYTVEHTASGADALQLLAQYKYDILVIDWALPEVEGIEICRKARMSGLQTPVLMLTGRDEINAKVSALDAGADDYLTKPFHIEELSARLRSLLRRGSVKSSNKIAQGYLELDRNTHEVYSDKVKIQLYPKEFALLELFLCNPNRVFSVDDILAAVWNSESDASDLTVRTFIKTLRQKITPNGHTSPIVTVRGFGYKLELED